jgi:uncharacterized membrane protein YjdF
MVAIIVIWVFFRHFTFETSMLVLLEIGILMHFCGDFIHIDGQRLYGSYVMWIRYDKYVHFVNSFVICILIRKIFNIQNIKMDLTNRIFILLVVLGLGAIVEIFEYGVTKTIPHNGVGDYDNNMQDLISNLVGGLFYLWITSINCLPAWVYHIIAKDMVVTKNDFQ